MRYPRTTKLIVSLSVLFISACNRVQPLVTPEFDLPLSSQARVQEAVRTALTNRGWAITDARRGRFEATYRRAGGATARIAVEYSGAHVTIKHLESTGLEYNEYGPTIHKTYNNWMANLQHEIEVAAGAAM
jgi:hypothetical protein